MTDLPLIFVGGLLGSGHCVGMCGPLAMALGAASPGPRANVVRQLAFSLGRIFTYAFCGAIVGFAGAWFTAHTQAIVAAQAVLALVAGVALIAVGLASAGVLPRARGSLLTAIPCSAATAVKSLLQARGLHEAVLAGMFTGFIPCGLVYAFLIKAVSAGGPLEGALAMAVFGAGTAPLLILTGVGSGALTMTTRMRLIRFASWCVVLTGVISVARGAWQFTGDANTLAPACPLCSQSEADHSSRSH